MLAGPHAQAHISGRFDHAGARCDVSGAYASLSYLASGQELDAYLAWLNLRAKNLVTFGSNRRAVQYVARELMQRSTINGRDVRRLARQAENDLYQEATGRNPPWLNPPWVTGVASRLATSSAAKK